MPQMKPMSWKSMFIFYSFSTLMFMLYIYFPKKKMNIIKKNKYPNLKTNKNIKLKW